MAEAIAIYGQQFPSSNTLTALYTTPANTSLVGSTFTACNQAGYSVKFRLSVAVAGAADDPKQYLYYDISIDPYQTFAATIGVTLATTDVVRCQSDSGTVSFNLFGIQVTPD